MPDIESSESRVNVANFGCGVDSTAAILHYGIQSFDEIIFADTGTEKHQTYEYLDYLIKQKDWPITVVASEYGKLYDYYFQKKTFPTRFKRDCTSKFKIRPIRKYLRSKYGKQAHFTQNIFIDYSEFHRVRESDVSYVTLRYPLVDDKITRERCLKIIQDFGYLVPEKSGCFMCPFTKKQQWYWLRSNNPDEWDKTRALEKNSTYRKFSLINVKGKDSESLVECGCFNH